MGAGKRCALLRRGYLLAATLVISAPQANAASAWWDNTGGVTLNDWGSIANWSTTVAGGTNPASIPGTATADLATFSITGQLGIVQTVNLNAARSLGELSFTNTAAISLLGGSGNQTLTLAGITAVGITKSGTGAVTIGSATAGQQVALALSANQSFTNNNNTGAINILNGVASSTAVARTLTLNGTSTAANTISGTIANNGAGIMSLIKAGAGTWVLSGANTYTGVTTVSLGTL
jgi:autotransporter-associated beta strand protein